MEDTGEKILEELASDRIHCLRQLQADRDSTIFVFWNDDALRYEDFVTLSQILEAEQPDRDIELLLFSYGGNGEAGYRIGHTFQQWTQQRNRQFRVIIPSMAMSAATIIALGASEIIMGLQSQIGPIDPQIPLYDETDEEWRYIPALSRIYGLKLISEFMGKIPAMGILFEKILQRDRISLETLGELERMRESGKQYAERLLLDNKSNDPIQVRETVERLTDYYKNHGHPIDAFEAKSVLNLNVRFCEGDEWNRILELSQKYDEFIGSFGVLPNLEISSIIETANLRSLRVSPIESKDEKGVFVATKSYPKTTQNQEPIINIKVEGSIQQIQVNRSVEFL